MLTWWRRRKERQKQVLRDADNLVALFSEGAYSEALARLGTRMTPAAIPALACRREIATRIGKDIGFDTATRYVSE